MAIDKKQFTEKVEQNLKADKSYKKFFINFTMNNKRINRVVDFSNKEWDKRTRISKAKMELMQLKEKIANPQSELDENMKLDAFIDMHFNGLPKTSWTTTKRNHYNKYIKKLLGSKKVKDIKQMHIKECIREHAKADITPRTIKTTLEILNPLFKEAIANRLVTFNPCDGVTIKRPKTKKTVLHATDELGEIMETIETLFGKDPFLLSFYLFAISGRRKSEILHLRWENINFDNNTYLIEDTKNGEHQTHTLPLLVKKELEKFKESKGWVYESPRKPGYPIGNIEKQTVKIKAVLPNFTLHRLRNVMVSAMAERGISATLMSAALGHNNTATLAKYVTLGYEAGSKEAAALMDTLKRQNVIDTQIVEKKE